MKRLLQFTAISFLALLANASLACPIIGDSNICTGSLVTYSSTTTGAGYTYEWSAFGGSISPSGTTASVNWGTAGSGQVTLIVRDAFGAVVCTDLHNITINAIPEPSILPNLSSSCVNGRDNSGRKRELDCFAVCDSTWVTYSTLNNAGSTYTWVVTGSATYTTSTTNEQSVYWTGTGVGEIQVIETTSAGCIGEATICVEIVANPSADVSALPSPVSGTIDACLNQDILFLNNSTIGDGSDFWSYTWLFGDGTTEEIDATTANGNTSHAYSTPGTYTVTFIAENECHCKDTAYLTVVVSADPGPEISCVSTVCPGTQVTYSTNSGCATYLWTAINGTIVGDSTNSTVTVEWGSTGPGYLSVEVTGCAGVCTSPVWTEVPIIPVSADIMGPTLVCHGSCEEYSITCDIPIDSIVWHAPPGVTIVSDSIDKHRFTLCFYDNTFDSGLLSVEYYKFIPGAIPSMNCGGTSEIMIYQRPEMILSYPFEICDNTVLTGSHFPLSPSGNITWTVTGAGGSPTYTTTTQPANVAFQPTWFWGPGIFTITAEDLDGNYCNAPQNLNIKVNPVPNPPDSILGPLEVCPNSAAEYIGVYSPSSNTLEWDITGGAPVSTVGPSSSILWGATGPYTISLVQLDPISGCKSEPYDITILNCLPLSPPTLDGNDSSCANSSEIYTVLESADDYQWSIAPTIAGSVINGQGTANAEIEWNNYNGLATITCVITKCGATISNTFSVDLSAPLAPSMSVPSPVCEDETVTMTSTTTGATLTWDFGDGSTATGSSVSHSYNNPGNYVVKLTAQYSDCGDTISSFANVMVNPRPNISISTPDPTIYCGPVGTVNMYVASPSTGVDYDWYSTPSTFLTSGTTYSSSTIGGYYVIGENDFGCKDTSNIISIDTSCGNCNPSNNYTLDFDIHRVGCNKDSVVAFLGGLAFGPTWNFDDPYNASTASGNTATHQYTEPGYYRIQLCASVPNNQTPPTDTCEVCIMKVDTIRYKPFFTDSIYCEDGLDSLRLQMLNETKILTGFSTPSYEWFINGVSSSTTSNPLLTLSPGTHTIELLVNGNCTYSKTYTITAPPVASFTMQDSICVGAPLPLSNTSTGAYSNLEWSFGDGASSLIIDPTKVYSTDGEFTISLEISNDLGCLSVFRDTVTVLPNTLSASITILPSEICKGDSALISSSVTGGYPAYDYLWNTLSTDANTYGFFTGDYVLNVTDQYACQAKSNVVNLLVNPVPSPVINGDITLCQYESIVYKVNYPSTSPGGYTISWDLNGTINPWLTSNAFSYYAGTVGLDTLIVTVLSPEGCSGSDTIFIETFANPNVSIDVTGGLCAGELHLLDGNSTSTNIMQTYWNNGHLDDSLYTSIAGWYRYTVVDSNSCQATAEVSINPLPDFCGLLTGCYEICDTVSELVWYAPTGYPSYQWLLNGIPIVGANGDSLSIPLYTSGNYQVVITTGAGCTDTSDLIEIEFVKCGCELQGQWKIDCNEIDAAGNQTYSFSFSVINSFAAGTVISITSSEGSISGLSPTVLAAGSNVVTGIFTDLPVVDDTVCFSVSLSNEGQHCDSLFCIPLPDCGDDCESDVKLKSEHCIGYDSLGNPMYDICLDVNWGGASSTTVSVNSPGGTISPGTSYVINPGSNIICFTYTDLPSYSGVFEGYLYYFDPLTQETCRDSVRFQLHPCPEDTCVLAVSGICAHCKKETEEGWTYQLEITINNTIPGVSNVSLANTSGGSFGLITPNPISSGITTLNIPFTDTGSRDSIICFRILVNNGTKLCWADVCVYLPDCDAMNVRTLGEGLSYFVLYPNPSSDRVKVDFNASKARNRSIIVTNPLGKQVYSRDILDDQSATLDLSSLSRGVYSVQFVVNGKIKGSIKFTKL